MTRAIFAGSFDPFTNGHLDVLKQASKMFDEVHVLVAKNPLKRRTYELEKMVIAIEDVCQAEKLTNCCVNILPYSCSVIQYANMIEADFLVRGIRSTDDYMYEAKMASINYHMNPNIRTIYIQSHNDISSTLVRTLQEFNQPFSHLIPKEIAYLFRD